MINIWNIFRKEVASFFNSLVGYIVMVVFLLGVGSFIWVFGENIFVTEIASLESLFLSAPIFFIFLIPAITMRSFSEELKTGTIEILSTKPVTDWQIILGKYAASVFLVFFTLLPTLIYYLTLSAYGQPPGNLDTGPIWGAYMGLIALGAIFCGIGIFASAISQNQVVAFVLSLFFCVIFMYGFSFLADIEALRGVNYFIDRLGINAHYESISLGVVDTRDILYFATMVSFTLLLTRTALLVRKK